MKGPIVITGGGTGGHVFPMQAIGEELLARGVSANDIRYVGSRRGQEASLLAHTPIALTLLPGRGIRRSLKPSDVFVNLVSITRLVGALVTATWKVARWKPSVVVSVGGYASFAVSFAAALWRRPLILVDFDATPGVAHRVLARFATTRCTAFGDDDARSVHTGVPLRATIATLDRSLAARSHARATAVPPIDEHRTVIVVMTGSLGARSVNRAVTDLAGLWSSRDDLTIVHVSGQRDFDTVTRRAPALQGLDYRIVAFADMSQLWQWCDVALCRAGANTIAELTALGIPSLLVPLPGAPGDHQTKNALALVAAGAARMLPDVECDGPRLAKVLSELMSSSTREAMSARALSLARRDATARIVDVIVDVRS